MGVYTYQEMNINGFTIIVWKETQFHFGKNMNTHCIFVNFSEKFWILCLYGLKLVDFGFHSYNMHPQMDTHNINKCICL
jgi:hypothetical protein